MYKISNFRTYAPGVILVETGIHSVILSSGFPLSNEKLDHKDHKSSLKSFQFGFSDSIRSNFHFLFHFFNCFSLCSAPFTSVVAS